MNELGRLLKALGRDPDERLAVGIRRPGRKFSARPTTVREISSRPIPTDRDLWYGAAVLHERVTAKGGARDVTGIRELYADLDVAPGKLPDYATAQRVVAELSAMLGIQPVAVVATGGGLQPHWRIERGEDTDWPDSTDPRWAAAVALYRRWGRLVAAVAERWGGRVDAVYNLDRVLRTPGSVNHKYQPPVPVELGEINEEAGAVSLERLAEVLDEWDVEERPEDRQLLGEPVAPPQEWTWADRTCTYVRQMIAGWSTETPEARHPWLVAQATRLAAAHRLGCLAEEDYGPAVEALSARFLALLRTGTVREAAPGEISGALSWGRGTVAAMTEERARTELGNHEHPPEQDLSYDPDEETASEAPGASETAGGAQETGGEQNGGQAPGDDPREGLTGHLRMAEHFVRDHQRNLRYVHRIGWHVWPRNGTHWHEDMTGTPVRALRWTFQRLLDRGNQLAANPETEEVGKALIRAVQQSCRRNDVEGILRLAGNLHPLAVAPNELDADPELFNTPAGVLDLRTLELRPHRREDLITKVAGAAPDPHADDGLWRAFLERILPDPEVRGFVQRLLGSAMLGRSRDHVLPVWHGTGANGKSVLMRVMLRVFGSYGAVIGADTLLSHSYSQHPTGLMTLRGARLAFASETDRGRRLNSSLVKQLTGGDPITARRMRQDEVTWDPTHLLVMVTNFPPIVDAEDEAMWRRVLIVPFDVTIPPEERDPDLADKLMANLGAVMAWLVEGYREYRSRGLAIPDAVRARTDQYRGELDILGQFLAERTRRGHGSVSSTELFREWERWCRDRGEEPGGMIQLAKAMQTRGFKKYKSHGTMRWQGITLRDDFDMDE